MKGRKIFYQSRRAILFGGIVLFVGIVFFVTKTSNESVLFQEDLQSTQERVEVKRVIDGDTIELSDGRRVRYIGIDTPEKGYEKEKKDECFAYQASEKNRNLVEGKNVELLKDISATDKYGRLLRYVFVEGELVQEELLREGYADVLTIPPDVRNAKSFRELRDLAREEKRGLWGACEIE